jgi:ABC-type transporter Mla subunit MlaD
MARHPTRNRALAGAFLLLMATAVLVLLVLVGGWDAWFTAYQTLHIHFDAAPNIKIGSPVQLAGHPVGRVTEIGLEQVPCPPEREHEGMCYVVDVTVELPTSYTVHQNATVTLQQALVGQSAIINIVDIGYGKRVTEPLTGRRTSPFADAAAQLGIGETEKQNVAGILENLYATTGKIREDLPEIIEKLKTTGTNLAEVSEKVKATLNRIDGILDENRKNLQEAVANTRDLTADAKKKAGEALENLKAASNKINAILEENRTPLKETVANTRDLSADGKALLKKVDGGVDDLLPRVKAASADLKQGLADFKIIAGDTKALIATQKGNLASTAQNLKETSEHLRALSKEVRRAPWRLFATPDKEEVESLNLYDAARAFAMAATDLESVSDTLQVMLEAKEKGVAVDEEMLKAMAENLQKTYEKYQKAEEALLKEYERIQK